MSVDKNGKNILVIVADDQEYLREAVSFEFEMLDAKVMTAEDGKEASKLFEEHADEVDIVVSDIRMPICDGVDFLRATRRDRPLFPPFVFMSGFADLALWDALDQGADAYISKPIDVDHFHDVVKSLLQPMKQRWRRKLETRCEKKLTCNVRGPTSESAFELGRAGFFIAQSAIDSAGPLRVNNTLEFDLVMPDHPLKRLSGSGRIAWTRSKSPDGLINGIGVEFLYLHEDSHSPTVKYITENQISKVIPRGEIRTR